MTCQVLGLGNRATITVSGQPLEAAMEAKRRRRSGLDWQLRCLNNAMFAKLTVGKCGLPLDEVTVGHRKADGRGALANLSSCGSVHGCLRCARKIRVVRAAEIGHTCRAHLAKGLGIEFVTFTLPHWSIDRLKALIEGLRGAWRMMLQRKAYKRLRAEFKVLGMIRSTEFTHSDVNGWHPHLHVLFFLDQGDLDPEDHMEFVAQLYNAWKAVVLEALPGREVHPVYGIDARPVRDEAGIGEYVSKIELEMARSDLKTNRTRASQVGSRTPWQIVADFLDCGETGDKDLWREYVLATHSTRVMGASPSLKRLYGRPVEAEQTDEEIAAASAEVDGKVKVSAEVFMAARNKRQATVVTDMIAAFEATGIDGMVEVLSQLGPIVVEDRAAIGELPLIRFRSQKANVVVDSAGRMARLVRKTRGVLIGRVKPVETHTGATGWAVRIKDEYRKPDPDEPVQLTLKDEFRR